MTADEAIERIIWIFDNEKWNTDDDDEIAEDMAINALEKQKWIPVTERLPEEHEETYQTFSSMGCDGEDIRMESDMCLVTVKDDDGELSVYGSYTINGKFPKDVIAWQPFPEPYREVTE